MMIMRRRRRGAGGRKRRKRRRRRRGRRRRSTGGKHRARRNEEREITIVIIFIGIFIFIVFVAVGIPTGCASVACSSTGAGTLHGVLERRYAAASSRRAALSLRAGIKPRSASPSASIVATAACLNSASESERTKFSEYSSTKITGCSVPYRRDARRAGPRSPTAPPGTRRPAPGAAGPLQSGSWQRLQLPAAGRKPRPRPNMAAGQPAYRHAATSRQATCHRRARPPWRARGPPLRRAQVVPDVGKHNRMMSDTRKTGRVLGHCADMWVVSSRADGVGCYPLLLASSLCFLLICL